MNIQLKSCLPDSDSHIVMDFDRVKESICIEAVEEMPDGRGIANVELDLNDLLAAVVAFDHLRNLEEDYLTRMEE